MKVRMRPGDGPVSRICCAEGKLIAVIWGRIFWRPLETDWPPDRWVPLALPGESSDPTSEAFKQFAPRTSSTVSVSKPSPETRRRRRRTH